MARVVIPLLAAALMLLRVEGGGHTGGPPPANCMAADGSMTADDKSTCCAVTGQSYCIGGDMSSCTCEETHCYYRTTTHEFTSEDMMTCLTAPGRSYCPNFFDPQPDTSTCVRSEDEPACYTGGGVFSAHDEGLCCAGGGLSYCHDPSDATSCTCDGVPENCYDPVSHGMSTMLKMECCANNMIYCANGPDDMNACSCDPAYCYYRTTTHEWTTEDMDTCLSVDGRSYCTDPSDSTTCTRSTNYAATDASDVSDDPATDASDVSDDPATDASDVADAVTDASDATDAVSDDSGASTATMWAGVVVAVVAALL
jgi:hypothetical protein